MSEISYLYKLYDNTGTYLTTIDSAYISSEFMYSQDINEAGTEVVVELSRTLDDIGVDVVQDVLLDHLDQPLTDHLNRPLLASQEYLFTTLPLNLANRIDIYQYDSYDPNGVRVFSGLITSWSGDYKQGSVTITAQSYGVQLDKIVLGLLGGESVAEQEDSNNEEDLFWALVGGTVSIGQSFQVASPVSISAIQVLVRAEVAPAGLYVSLSNNVPGSATSVLGSSSMVLGVTSELQWVTLSFTSPISLDATTDYNFTVSATVGSNPWKIHVGTNTAGGYGSGQLYIKTGVGGSYVVQTGEDLAFRILASNNSYTTTYNSYDPAAIIRNAIDAYNQRGGAVTYTGDSIDSTGATTSYTFRTSTILDVVKKSLQLAPGNWYWYLDVGENVLHFHQRSIGNDHVFTIGKHIEDLNIEYTLDEMANNIIFVGGDDGSGYNLVTANPDTSSINSYGTFTKVMTDNRVSIGVTADILSQSELNQFSRPVFRTNVTILASEYNIKSVRLGQTVGFANGNDLTNSLTLQIVGVTRYPDKIDLRLASNLPSVAHRIEDIKRNLDSLYTINNPDTIT